MKVAAEIRETCLRAKDAKGSRRSEERGEDRLSLTALRRNHAPGHLVSDFQPAER